MLQSLCTCDICQYSDMNMQTPVSLQDLNALRYSLDTLGYGVVRGVIDQQSILEAIRRIDQQVETVAAAYGATKDPDTCSVLLSLTKQLKNTPSNWTDPQNPFGRLRFGNYGRRGWMRGIGSGKMFDGEDFTEDANIIRIQESCRHVTDAYVFGIKRHGIQCFLVIYCGVLSGCSSK